MNSVFNDPYFIATCNAQTYVMNELESATPLCLDHRITSVLTGEVLRHYRRGDSFLTVIELILNTRRFTDVERRGYAVAIKLSQAELRRRRKMQQQEFERGRPSAPVEVYEQEMY